MRVNQQGYQFSLPIFIVRSTNQFLSTLTGKAVVTIGGAFVVDKFCRTTPVVTVLTASTWLIYLFLRHFPRNEADNAPNWRYAFNSSGWRDSPFYINVTSYFNGSNRNSNVAGQTPTDNVKFGEEKSNNPVSTQTSEKKNVFFREDPDCEKEDSTQTTFVSINSPNVHFGDDQKPTKPARKSPKPHNPPVPSKPYFKATIPPKTNNTKFGSNDNSAFESVSSRLPISTNFGSDDSSVKQTGNVKWGEEK